MSSAVEDKKSAKRTVIVLAMMIALNILYCIMNKTSVPFTPWTAHRGKPVAWMTFFGLIGSVVVIALKVQVMNS